MSIKNKTSRVLIPTLAFVGFSGSGKTTYLEKLISLLVSKGIKLALLKHAHHDFDIDIPGKDSYRLRKAGATQVMVASRKRRALITETPETNTDPDLGDCLAELDSNNLDLILVEGFKHAEVKKIEIHRGETGKDLLYPDDDNIIALVSDNFTNGFTDGFTDPGQKPVRDIVTFDINAPQGIIEFILNYIDNNTP